MFILEKSTPSWHVYTLAKYWPANPDQFNDSLAPVTEWRTRSNWFWWSGWLPGSAGEIWRRRRGHRRQFPRSWERWGHDWSSGPTPIARNHVRPCDLVTDPSPPVFGGAGWAVVVLYRESRFWIINAANQAGRHTLPAASSTWKGIWKREPAWEISIFLTFSKSQKNFSHFAYKSISSRSYKRTQNLKIPSLSFWRS
jgi:hypothetical protein